MSSLFKKIKATELQYYYGIDFHNENVIQVTDIVLKNCLQPNGEIFFNSDKNSLFGDPYYGHVKTLYCVYENSVIQKVLESVNQRLESNLLLFTESLDLILCKEYKSDFSTAIQIPDNRFFYGSDFDQLTEITSLVLQTYTGNDGTIQIPTGEKIWDDGSAPNFIFIKTTKYVHRIKGSCSISIGNKKPKNVIISCMSNFNEHIGGITCCYKMAKNLDNLSEGWWVKIHGGNNPIHNKLWNGEPFDKENTVVIYSEGLNGNPFDAKYVVRWILAPLGTFNNHNQYLNYNPNDLVYYFNSENRFYKKDASIYKLLSIVNIPCIDFDSSPRPLQYCHTWRKSQMHASIIPIHPQDSVELNGNHTIQDVINAFKSFEYFVSYDPLTFYSFLAAMSGCISIVYPLEGLSKKDWYKTTCATEYLEKNNVNLYGIAYGNNPEEIEFAKSTLHLCQAQWLDIESFMIENTIQPFIEDIADFENQPNTVKNNY